MLLSRNPVTLLPANKLRACRRRCPTGTHAQQGTHREKPKPTLPTARKASEVGLSYKPENFP